VATAAGDARSRRDAEPSEQLQPVRRIDLVARLSWAFDLAESQQLGHAARVAHIALAVGRRLGLEARVKHRLLYTALLHDAGVAVRTLPEDFDATGGHTAAGAWVASLFGLNEQVQEAIRCTHERWDGEGRPQGLAMAAIPEEALLVGAAHWVSDQITPEDNPLRARAKVLGGTPQNLGPLVGARIADALFAELREDAVWMPLWDDRLPAQLAEAAGGEGKPSLRNLDHAATAVGDIIDAASREPGRARRVAALASELARLLGYDEQDQTRMSIAGRVMDIGHLGVPRHIGEKPDILSVDEMEIMRRHPGWGAQLLRRVPGFETLSEWVQHHHERPDGRGYPSMLEHSDVPAAAFLLGAADAYWALRADRSDRSALTQAEALEVMAQGVGEQFDAEAVEALPAALDALEAAESPKAA
jgi:HD-GYP domain-containing protein (c-di-GMP phosphodiesterase class II)